MINFIKRLFPIWFKKGVNRIFARLFPRYTFSFPMYGKHQEKSDFVVEKDNPLALLGDKYQPTKRLHNYLVYYWLHFRDIRYKVKNVIEIGVESTRSIKMWEEFFPNAMIYGIDINPECKKFEEGRCKIFIGDQSDKVFLKKVVEEINGPLDIIIDDGSHRVMHQLKTFDFLFPCLSDHGIYVVEDTGGCVEDFEMKTVNSFKVLIDSIMYWPKGFEAKNYQHLMSFSENVPWIHKNITGIAFYRWIVFIMRGRNPQDNPFLRE